MNVVRGSLFDDSFGGLFHGFLVRPFAYETAAQVPSVRMDVVESEDAYRIEFDLPGARKEDINVTITGDTVTVAAEVRREREAKDAERVLRSERYEGKVERTFTLEHEVDEAGAEARYSDGVLELVLPKKANAVRKRLTVN